MDLDGLKQAITSKQSSSTARQAALRQEAGRLALQRIFNSSSGLPAASSAAVPSTEALADILKSSVRKVAPPSKQAEPLFASISSGGLAGSAVAGSDGDAGMSSLDNGHLVRPRLQHSGGTTAIPLVNYLQNGGLPSGGLAGTAMGGGGGRGGGAGAGGGAGGGGAAGLAVPLASSLGLPMHLMQQQQQQQQQQQMQQSFAGMSMRSSAGLVLPSATLAAAGQPFFSHHPAPGAAAAAMRGLGDSAAFYGGQEQQHYAPAADWANTTLGSLAAGGGGGGGGAFPFPAQEDDRAWEEQQEQLQQSDYMGSTRGSAASGGLRGTADRPWKSPMRPTFPLPPNLSELPSQQDVAGSAAESWHSEEGSEDGEEEAEEQQQPQRGKKKGKLKNNNKKGIAAGKRKGRSSSVSSADAGAEEDEEAGEKEEEDSAEDAAATSAADDNSQEEEKGSKKTKKKQRRKIKEDVEESSSVEDAPPRGRKTSKQKGTGGDAAEGESRSRSNSKSRKATGKKPAGAKAKGSKSGSSSLNSTLNRTAASASNQQHMLLASPQQGYTAFLAAPSPGRASGHFSIPQQQALQYQQQQYAAPMLHATSSPMQSPARQRHYGTSAASFPSTTAAGMDASFFRPASASAVPSAPTAVPAFASAPGPYQALVFSPGRGTRAAGTGPGTADMDRSIAETGIWALQGGGSAREDGRAAYVASFDPFTEEPMDMSSKGKAAAIAAERERVKQQTERQISEAERLTRYHALRARKLVEDKERRERSRSRKAAARGGGGGGATGPRDPFLPVAQAVVQALDQQRGQRERQQERGRMQMSSSRKQDEDEDEYGLGEGAREQVEGTDRSARETAEEQDEEGHSYSASAAEQPLEKVLTSARGTSSSSSSASAAPAAFGGRVPTKQPKPSLRQQHEQAVASVVEHAASAGGEGGGGASRAKGGSHASESVDEGSISASGEGEEDVLEGGDAAAPATAAGFARRGSQSSQASGGSGQAFRQYQEQQLQQPSAAAATASAGRPSRSARPPLSVGSRSVFSGDGLAAPAATAGGGGRGGDGGSTAGRSTMSSTPGYMQPQRRGESSEGRRQRLFASNGVAPPPYSGITGSPADAMSTGGAGGGGSYLRSSSPLRSGSGGGAGTPISAAPRSRSRPGSAAAGASSSPYSTPAGGNVLQGGSLRAANRQRILNALAATCLAGFHRQDEYRAAVDAMEACSGIDSFLILLASPESLVYRALYCLDMARGEAWKIHGSTASPDNLNAAVRMLQAAEGGAVTGDAVESVPSGTSPRAAAAATSKGEAAATAAASGFGHGSTAGTGGTGAGAGAEPSIVACFKYNTSNRSFQRVPSTRITLTTDAVCIAGGKGAARRKVL